MILPFDNARLAAQVGEIDVWRSRLDRRGPLSRRWAGRLRQDLEAEAVAASTRLEGVAVTVEEVRRILAGDLPAEVPDHDRALVQGYRDAMTYVLRRGDDPNFEWNRELLVGVQDRVLAGRFDEGAGRLRTGPTWIVSRETGDVVFEPAPPERVPQLVDELCSTLAALETHPAIGAAWFHVGLAAIHPFGDGNGRTARVLASLAMYSGGFRSPTFTSLEEWWGRHTADYYQAFEGLGSVFEASADVTSFLEAHVGAQLSQIRALDLRERTQRRLWTLIENLLYDRDLPERLANALWDAFFGREVNAGYYRGTVDVSPATATNDLRAAAAAGFIVAEGERRWRRYYADRRLYDELGDQLGRSQLPPAPQAARAALITELGRRLVAHDAERAAEPLSDAAISDSEEESLLS